MDEIEKPAEHMNAEKLKKILDELDDEALTEWEKEALDGIGRFLKNLIYEERNSKNENIE